MKDSEKNPVAAESTGESSVVITPCIVKAEATLAAMPPTESSSSSSSSQPSTVGAFAVRENVQEQRQCNIKSARSTPLVASGIISIQDPLELTEEGSMCSTRSISRNENTEDGEPEPEWHENPSDQPPQEQAQIGIEGRESAGTQNGGVLATAQETTTPLQVSVTAWEVHIDEETGGGMGAAGDLVDAKPSSEDHLRRWNRFLLVIITALALLVGGAVIGTVIYFRNSNENSPSTDEPPPQPTTRPPSEGVLDLNSNYTDHPSATSPPQAQVVDLPLEPPVVPTVDWNQRGQSLFGTSTEEEFGRSISLSADGTILAVGGWGYENYRGCVQVFKYKTPSTPTGSNSNNNDTKWEPMGSSNSSLIGQQEGNQLGVSVDLSEDGTMLVAGANQYNYGDTSNRTGLVRAFRYNPIKDTWNQVGSDITGILEHEQFGWKVSMSSDGNIIAASARRHDGRIGYVRVFQLDAGDDWKQMGRTLKGVAFGDQFGTSLAMSNDGRIIAAGADENDAAGLNAGHVRAFIYSDEDEDWVQLGQTLDALAARNDFGYSVALSSDGTMLAAGAWEHNETQGSVRVFSFESETKSWQPFGSTLYGNYSGSQFGVSVGLSSDGNVLVVGANEYNFGQQDRPGRAFVYKYDGLDWELAGPPFVGDASDDRFGWSVSASGDGGVVAMSAYRNDKEGDRAGQVQVWEVQNGHVS